jgi:hypothetical protein
MQPARRPHTEACNHTPVPARKKPRRSCSEENHMIGLHDQTVRGASSLDDASARHRWNIPADYSVLGDCLLRHQDRADDPCLIYEDDAGLVQRWSWGAMLEAVNRFANALRALGVGRGDVVAIYLPQRPETAIAHFACYRLGALSLPISKLFAPDAVRYRLEHSEAKVLVVEDDTAERFAGFTESIATLKHIVVVGTDAPASRRFDKLMEQASGSFNVDRPPTSEDPFLLMFTSGTTGNPKAVIHLNRAMAAHNGLDYMFNFFQPDDLYFSSADWAWIGGLGTGARHQRALRSGAHPGAGGAPRRHPRPLRSHRAQAPARAALAEKDVPQAAAALHLLRRRGGEPGAQALGARGPRHRVQHGLRPDRGQRHRRHLHRAGEFSDRGAGQADAGP